MSVPVNTAATFSTGVFCHEALSQTTGFVKVPAPSIETYATQMWTAGYILNKNKLTQTVKHTRVQLPIVQKGHDCGPMIPDLTPTFPSNYLYAVIWPFTSRKIMFSASKVKMDGKATGCACTFAIPPLPMMTCGFPTSAPAAWVHPIQNLWVNVSVGMTWSDYLWGLVKIWREILVNLLFHYVSKYFPSKEIEDTLSGVGKKLREAALDSMGFSLKGATKKALHSLTKGGLSLFTENPTIKFGVSAPTANTEVSYSSKEGFKARTDLITGNETSFGTSSNGTEQGPSGTGSPSASSLGEALP